MKVMKSVFVVLSIIMVMAVLAQNASALPSSSLNGGKWGGYSTYSDGAGLNVEVVFNVYAASSGEFTWGGQVSMPTTDKYIYVYQVFNSNSSSSTKSIESFSVLNSDKSDIAPSAMHQTCSQIDSTGAGISPDPAISAIQGLWVWSDGIVAGKYSWYLIFSSNYAPTKGAFALNDENNAPVPTPEPATITLVGVASALYAAKRRRKRQAV